MSTFAQAVENTETFGLTENGMPTLVSSLAPLVDLFFGIGSSRGKDISAQFERAWHADKTLAARMLFWARDIRGGAGERDTPRKLLLALERGHRDDLIRLLPFVSEYGRWDDLLIFETAEAKTVAYSLIAEALRAGNGLAAKWMPRKGPIANELRKYMNHTPKSYRKLLVGLTKVVETQMCANDWTSINYDHVPSVAAARYRKAFTKHDGVGYAAYQAGLVAGTNKINAGAIYPYDVIKGVTYGGVESNRVAVAQWDSLPNYLGDNAIIPMIDVSGSMACSIGGNKNLTCMDVALGLGLYIADKQTGPFKDMTLTFSAQATIDILRGDIIAKLNQLRRQKWGMNTNLENGFREILRIATANRVSADQMPKYLLILSDMEFDSCVDERRDTAFTMAKRMYATAGYELPKVVFWNLNARQGNVPVRFDQNGVALISGFSPSIMKNVLAARNFAPADIMLETLNSDRYNVINL